MAARSDMTAGTSSAVAVRMGAAAAALVCLLVTLLFAASVGETAIPVGVVFDAVANRLWDAGHAIDRIDQGIVWNYRLSRGVVAACCGSALAVSGVLLQALLRNPLADPFILGISAGASTGAVAVTILGVGGGLLSLSVGAFGGALLAFGLILALAARVGRGTAAIILAGVAGSQLFNALTSFIVAKSASAEQSRGIMFWLLGNLSGVRWEDVTLALPVVVIGCAVCLWHARALDAFVFGADSAAALGVPVRRVYGVLVATAALMTAAMVSLVGSIGFVGLVIPHAMRALVGVKHGVLLPATALAGAVFLVVADVLSRIVISGQVLPIGVVTALVGAPAFALILWRRKAMS